MALCLTCLLFLERRTMVSLKLVIRARLQARTEEIISQMGFELGERVDVTSRNLKCTHPFGIRLPDLPDTRRTMSRI